MDQKRKRYGRGDVGRRRLDRGFFKTFQCQVGPLFRSRSLSSTKEQRALSCRAASEDGTARPGGEISRRSQTWRALEKTLDGVESRILDDDEERKKMCVVLHQKSSQRQEDRSKMNLSRIFWRRRLVEERCDSCSSSFSLISCDSNTSIHLSSLPLARCCEASLFRSRWHLCCGCRFCR